MQNGVHSCTAACLSESVPSYFGANQRVSLNKGSNMKSSKRNVGYTLIFGLVFAALVILPKLVSAQMRGLSYSLSPAGNAMSWNKQSGLEGGYLYGGQLGFGFGRYVELSGLYMISSGVETNIGNIDFLGLVAEQRTPDIAEIFAPRSADITRYGGSLTFNLGSGVVYPYVTGGTGILSLDPENRPKSQHIYLSGGAGLKFGLDNRLSLQVGVENVWYRYNPASTFLNEEDIRLLGFADSDIRDKEVGNWAVAAGITGYLGGRNPARLSELDRDLQSQFRGGFSGISLILEPTVGVVQFNERLPYRADQRVAGGSAGFDFGPYVGIRGFYLRGLEEEALSFDEFAMYGGEMKFRLNDAVSGIVPFLSLGAGYIDVNNQYEGREVANDQPFALGGGGVELRFSDNVKLFGSAKAVLVSNDDLGDLSSTESIQSSWMFNGGLSFTLGSRQKTEEIRYVDAQGRIREARSARDLEMIELSEQIAVAQAEARKAASNDSTRFITLPVLDDGEIYIRFGKTGAMKVTPEDTPREVVRETVVVGNQGLGTVDIEQLRVMIQSILRETLIENGIISSTGKAARTDTVVVEKVTERVVDQTGARQQGEAERQSSERTVEQRQESRQGSQDSGRTELQIKVEGPESVKVDEKAIEDRVLRRIEDRSSDTLVRSLQRQIAQMQERLDSLQASGAVVPQLLVSDAESDEQDADTIEKLNLEGLSATAGFNVAGKPFQFLFGVRADYGDVIGGRFRLAPDATFGIISTTSYNINVNVLTDIRIDSVDPWRPYAGFGLGLLGFRDPPGGVKGVQGTLNLLMGAEKPVGKNNAVFVEYLNMNLFKFNRLQAGYRFRFEAK